MAELHIMILKLERKEAHLGLVRKLAQRYWYMSSKGIWQTVLMRSAHFNSLTHFDVTQQPLLLHVPCNKFSGGVNHRKRVGMTYLPTMEVKNVNRCFRHLLITNVFAKQKNIEKFRNN